MEREAEEYPSAPLLKQNLAHQKRRAAARAAARQQACNPTTPWLGMSMSSTPLILLLSGGSHLNLNVSRPGLPADDFAHRLCGVTLRLRHAVDQRLLSIDERLHAGAGDLRQRVP